MSTVAIPECLTSLVNFLNNLDQRVPLDELRQHLQNLKVTKEDLSAFLQFGDDCYRRNMICESEWFELLCICWRDGQKSLIHNHAQSTCGLRIIHGAGIETTFELQADGTVVPADSCKVSVGDVCCTQDADIHQVSNVQANGDDLVTLHIYSPPLRNMCNYKSTEDNGC